MHPIFQNLLIGFGRVATRAGVRAIDSVLSDAEKALNEGSDRVKRARKRAQRLEEDEEES